MKKSTRIAIEVLAPPLLGTVLLVGRQWKQFAAVEFTLVGAIAYLVCAYVFAIVPSLVYSVLMEIWLKKVTSSPLGKISTAIVSTVLGYLAGFALGLFFGVEEFSEIGALVGLILGVILTVAEKDETEPGAA